MSESPSPLANLLQHRFGAQISRLVDDLDEVSIDVPVADWLAVAQVLRDDPEFRFELLIDLCGVDYLSWGEAEWDTTDVSTEGFSRGVEGAGPGRFSWADRPDAPQLAQRFAVVVHLLSISHNRRLRIRCFAPDEGLPLVPSLIDLWRGVNWYEREAFDLFGIVFDGHPDLRRILSDYGFVGHPFRKDFPLIGNVEVRYDEARQRVVYEPVSIEPRVGVPRTLRNDVRSLSSAGTGTVAATGK